MIKVLATEDHLKQFDKIDRIDEIRPEEPMSQILRERNYSLLWNYFKDVEYLSMDRYPIKCEPAIVTAVC